MYFIRHDDYGPALCFLECRRNDPDLIRRVDDGGIEHVDGFSRHPFVHQHSRTVKILAHISDPHCFERGARFRGMCQPHFWRVTLTVQLGSSHGPQWHAPAKDDDGVGLFEGVFHYQPAAYVKKKYHRAHWQHASEAKQYSACAPTL